MNITSTNLDMLDTLMMKADERLGRRLSSATYSTLLFLEWEIGTEEYYDELFSNTKLCLQCER